MNIKLNKHSAFVFCKLSIWNYSFSAITITRNSTLLSICCHFIIMLLIKVEIN